jgi:hypothetical protein
MFVPCWSYGGRYRHLMEPAGVGLGRYGDQVRRMDGIASPKPVPHRAYILQGNRRGGMVLIFDNFHYQKNTKLCKRKIYWRCWRKKCRAALETEPFDEALNNPVIIVIRVGLTSNCLF